MLERFDTGCTKSLKRLARVTGLEPATSGVTGRIIPHDFNAYSDNPQRERKVNIKSKFELPPSPSTCTGETG